MKVIIAGGGTGGHIFPAVAIAQALQELAPGIELLFIGALGRMEMEKIPQEGFEIIGLDIAGFNRDHLWKNIALPLKLWKSRKKAFEIIRNFKPDAVIGVGGYASFPMLHAAQSKGIPTLIQEQNSFAGKSNKLLGKKANSICVAYDNMEQFFPKSKIVKTGNPVRSKITDSKITKEEGIAFFGLDETKKTLLIVGGSLGARSINESIWKNLGNLDKLDIQMIWQTGSLFKEKAIQAVKPFSGKFLVKEFIKEMDYAYAAADFIISRAGALAAAELAIVGKPVIFIPFPFAAEDHQTSNALAFVKKDAAKMIKDSEVREELMEEFEIILKDEDLQKDLSENIKKFAINNAAIQIANQVVKIIKDHKIG